MDQDNPEPDVNFDEVNSEPGTSVHEGPTTNCNWGTLIHAYYTSSGQSGDEAEEATREENDRNNTRSGLRMASKIILALLFSMPAVIFGVIIWDILSMGAK